MKTKVQINPSLNTSSRKELSELIIEYIKTRTLDGFDKNIDKFIKYTPKYAKHKGVGVGDVDLVFSGEMLNDIVLLSQKKGELTIGYEKNSPSNGKAEGNIKGTYGQSSPVNKGRDFLGITKEEVNVLQDGLEEETDNADIKSFSGLSDDEIERMARDAAAEIFEGITF